MISFRFSDKSTFFIPLWLVVSLLGCQKDEECITINQKKILNDRYYFLFDNQNNPINNSGPNDNYYLPDTQASGEVSFEVFNAHRVGDRYCF
ncbi:MAG: hypothetical protein VW892_02220 [Flavobacteriaceae bacterium]|jgi:hypothetical protein|nr:hypothetical protein [Flavobacteriia bacterium]